MNKRQKRKKTKKRCCISNKIVDNKEVVLVDYALDYVKKQGYTVIALMLAIMFSISLASAQFIIQNDNYPILLPEEQKTTVITTVNNNNTLNSSSLNDTYWNLDGSDTPNYINNDVNLEIYSDTGIYNFSGVSGFPQVTTLVLGEGIGFDNNKISYTPITDQILFNNISVGQVFVEYFLGNDNNEVMNESGFFTDGDVCILGGNCLSSVSGGAGKRGDGFYLYNDSTTMFFNETFLNITIDNRDTDTNTQKTTNGFYLYNDSTTIFFNETQLNDTIDDRNTDTFRDNVSSGTVDFNGANTRDTAQLTVGSGALKDLNIFSFLISHTGTATPIRVRSDSATGGARYIHTLDYNGIGTWDLGANGLIGFATPSASVGLVFRNSSFDDRVDIRKGASGGLEIGTTSGSGVPATQMKFYRDNGGVQIFDNNLTLGSSGVTAGCLQFQDTDLGGWSNIKMLNGAIVNSSGAC